MQTKESQKNGLTNKEDLFFQGMGCNKADPILYNFSNVKKSGSMNNGRASSKHPWDRQLSSSNVFSLEDILKQMEKDDDFIPF